MAAKRAGEISLPAAHARAVIGTITIPFLHRIACHLPSTPATSHHDGTAWPHLSPRRVLHSVIDTIVVLVIVAWMWASGIGEGGYMYSSWSRIELLACGTLCLKSLQSRIIYARRVGDLSVEMNDASKET